MAEGLLIIPKEKKIIVVRQKDLEALLKKGTFSLEEINAFEIIGDETVYQFDWMKCKACGGKNLFLDPSLYGWGGCYDDLNRDFGCYDCSNPRK